MSDSCGCYLAKTLAIVRLVNQMSFVEIFLALTPKYVRAISPKGDEGNSILSRIVVGYAFVI